MSLAFEIRSIDPKDLSAVKAFTDTWIGRNYYSLEELVKIYSQSKIGESSCSLLAFFEARLIGIRLSFAPGQWNIDPEKFASETWGVEPNKVGYFKSLFVADDFQRQGVGSKLSCQSEKILSNMGAKAIVTHSWLESPDGLSQSYLLKFGFKEVARHPLFWHEIDYLCVRCQPHRCKCTAIEMLKIIERKS